jgi:cyclohexyl-isocyanide hydratase
MDPLRWLFHVRRQGSDALSPFEAYAPESLAREGFVHTSFRDAAAESARLYFPADAALEVLQIDPRRLDARVELVQTPRGPMPHIHGPIVRDAIRAVFPVARVATPEGMRELPDAVSGTRIGLIAFEGMTLLDLVGVYDPLSRITTMGFDPSGSCEIVAAGDPRAWVCDGAELRVRRVRPPLDAFDLLVVPGGFGARTLADDLGVVGWMRSFPDNRLVASVCTGALLLGAAGRLRGLRATTHQSALRDLGKYGATAVSERVVDQGQVVTAGGVTSGIDLGLHLARRLLGDTVAEKIARQMETRPAWL